MRSDEIKTAVLLRPLQRTLKTCLELCFKDSTTHPQHEAVLSYYPSTTNWSDMMVPGREANVDVFGAMEVGRVTCDGDRKGNCKRKHDRGKGHNGGGNDSHKDGSWFDSEAEGKGKQHHVNSRKGKGKGKGFKGKRKGKREERVATDVESRIARECYSKTAVWQVQETVCESACERFVLGEGTDGQECPKDKRLRHEDLGIWAADVAFWLDEYECMERSLYKLEDWTWYQLRWGRKGRRFFLEENLIIKVRGENFMLEEWVRTGCATPFWRADQMRLSSQLVLHGGICWQRIRDEGTLWDARQDNQIATWSNPLYKLLWQIAHVDGLSPQTYTWSFGYDSLHSCRFPALWGWGLLWGM